MTELKMAFKAGEKIKAGDLLVNRGFGFVSDGVVWVNVYRANPLDEQPFAMATSESEEGTEVHLTTGGFITSIPTVKTVLTLEDVKAMIEELNRIRDLMLPILSADNWMELYDEFEKKYPGFMDDMVRFYEEEH